MILAWSVTKPDKRNMTTSKKKKKKKKTIKSFWQIVTPQSFPTYGPFAVIWKPESGRMVYKIYIFINSDFLRYETWKQNWEISNTAQILLLWVKVLFLPENADLLQKNCWHQN